LLIAPVFVPQGEEAEYYLPAGKWTSFFHPERTIEGPQWVREHVPIDDIPVWVRPGSVLVLGPDGVGRPDYDYTQGLEVRAYALEGTGAVTVDVPVGRGLALAGVVTVNWVKGSDKPDVSVTAELDVASIWAN
jgi:alpha-glucosidase (family GH31 glycosyl hydrolase)